MAPVSLCPPVTTLSTCLGADALASLRAARDGASEGECWAPCAMVEPSGSAAWATGVAGLGATWAIGCGKPPGEGE